MYGPNKGFTLTPKICELIFRVNTINLSKVQVLHGDEKRFQENQFNEPNITGRRLYNTLPGFRYFNKGSPICS